MRVKIFRKSVVKTHELEEEINQFLIEHYNINVIELSLHPSPYTEKRITGTGELIDEYPNEQLVALLRYEEQ